jgi:hypothetical protein
MGAIKQSCLTHEISFQPNGLTKWKFKCEIKAFTLEPQQRIQFLL